MVLERTCAAVGSTMAPVKIAVLLRVHVTRDITGDAGRNGAFQRTPTPAAPPTLAGLLTPGPRDRLPCIPNCLDIGCRKGTWSSVPVAFPVAVAVYSATLALAGEAIPFASACVAGNARAWVHSARRRAYPTALLALAAAMAFWADQIPASSTACAHSPGHGDLPEGPLARCDPATTRADWTVADASRDHGHGRTYPFHRRRETIGPDRLVADTGEWRALERQRIRPSPRNRFQTTQLVPRRRGQSHSVVLGRID